jgi:hypothetical protein
MYRDNAPQASSGNEVHLHFNVTAVDAAGISKFFQDNARTMAKAINDHMRFNPSTRGNF